jgi:acyl-CoA synthetase (NDP forming)
MMSLDRLLKPTSVAIVGATERQVRSNNAYASLKEADLDLYLVNPNRPMVYGRSTVPNLRSIARPVDAVLCLVNAEASIDVVAEAEATGAGGVVVIAGGFAEVGAAGADLQRRLVEAARPREMPVIGPNCVGVIDAHTGIRLSGSPAAPITAGSVGVVSHSGALMQPIIAAAGERQIGFSTLLSVGNEAVADMVDAIEFLIDDPRTRAICLVVEKLRRGRAFLDCARRAIRAGKPVVALRLGRSERGRMIAKSHTASIVGDSWPFDVAFRQIGISPASDIDDLMDRLMLFDQLPDQRWTPIDGLAVLTSSGGAAGLVSDLCETEEILLPSLDHLSGWVSRTLPGVVTPNPLDMTGFVLTKPDILSGVLERLRAEPAIDAILLFWHLGELFEAYGRPIVDPFMEEAAISRKTMLISGVDASRPAPWTSRARRSGVGVGHGMRGTLHALSSMRDYFRGRAAIAAAAAIPLAPNATPRPHATVRSASGHAFVSFGASMRILQCAGIPTAPYAEVGRSESSRVGDLPFEEPFVVKLANLEHRSDVNAIRIGVTHNELDAAVAELRRLADRLDADGTVAIQPWIQSDGEVILGVQQIEDLGPLVILGLGGTQAELLRRIAGRLAPISLLEAEEMLQELRVPALFEGFRGKRPWQRGELTRLVVAASQLAIQTQGWVESIDINPLVFGPDGFVAVDGLFLLREP